MLTLFWHEFDAIVGVYLLSYITVKTVRCVPLSYFLCPERINSLNFKFYFLLKKKLSDEPFATHL